MKTSTMTHTVLFTGHMIDAKDREEARFPADKESSAREKIKEVLCEEIEIHRSSLKGIAGGAAGGDILFHELCRLLHIPSEMYLAFPEEDYERNSVSFAGKDWISRFGALTKTLPVQILFDGKNGRDDIWERTNLWMLHEALKKGGQNMTLIALWDGKVGDGEGGTKHMVSVANAKGSKIKIIDTKIL